MFGICIKIIEADNQAQYAYQKFYDRGTTEKALGGKLEPQIGG